MIRESRLQIPADGYSLILLNWRMEFPIGYLYHPFLVLSEMKNPGEDNFGRKYSQRDSLKLGRTSFMGHSGLNYNNDNKNNYKKPKYFLNNLYCTGKI